VQQSILLLLPGRFGVGLFVARRFTALSLRCIRQADNRFRLSAFLHTYSRKTRELHFTAYSTQRKERRNFNDCHSQTKRTEAKGR
jgi:hypothetical protein